MNQKQVKRARRFLRLHMRPDETLDVEYRKLRHDLKQGWLLTKNLHLERRP